MTTINTATTGHGSKTEVYADGSSVQYNTFPNATATDKRRLKKMQEAHGIVDRLAKKINIHGSCNKYFKGLPAGRSFKNIWADASIFLCLSPSLVAQFFGATHSNNKDVAITAWCIDSHNRWMIAATIVHELAHVGGAPGGGSHAAEKAADKCGFRPQYDPTIMGSIQGLSLELQRMA